MKLIFTADLHGKDGIYVNILIDYIDYLATYAKKNKINTIVFLGDILHKANKIRNETFIPLFKKLQELKEDGFILIFILGNHDMFTMNKDSLVETFSPFGTVIKSETQMEFDGIKINLCPYTTDEMEVPTVNADYLLTHLPISEFVFDNDMEIKDKNAFHPDFFSNYKKVFTGHYHKRQEKYNIEYIGSPYQLSFGEAGDTNKGFVVFEPSTGKEEFIQYKNAPKYYEIDYDTLVNDGVEETDIQNSFVKIFIDKKIENFTKVRNSLYKIGAIDIVPTFRSPSEKILDENLTKVEINKPIKEMLQTFIKEKEFYYGKEKLDNKILIDLLEGIESEL